MNKIKLILSGILCIFFIVILVLALNGNTSLFDAKIYSIVASAITDVKTFIYKIITFLGSTMYMVSLTIILFIIFLYKKKKNHAIIIASFMIISTLLNNLIKIIVQRPRPEVLRLVTEKSTSFPSGHTMASVTMYGLLIYMINKSNIEKKYKIIFSIILGLLPILVMLSRIYLGAHYATDVIAGAIMSTIILLVGTYIIDKNKLL